MIAGVKLRNPLLDAFEKYVVRGDRASWSEYEPRTAADGDRPSVPARGNPLDGFDARMDAYTSMFIAKAELRRRMAFAVPNDAAVAAIAELDMPLVELGAGTGYWAWILEQAGVPVTAFDHKPTSENVFCEPDFWHPVLEGDHRVLEPPGAFVDHALLLCWPPYDDPMAADCLNAFQGDVLVYVGEGAGGCTGDTAFHDALGHEHWDDEAEEYVPGASGWSEVRTVSIPQWPGLHDYMTIYRSL